MTPASSGASQPIPPPAGGGIGDALLATALSGLAGTPRRLPPALLYDARGSSLFELICELPEYYLTRTEMQILERCAPALARLLATETWLVELGSGASLKTRLLLDALPQVSAYVPVDISTGPLLAAAADLQAAYPHLQVLPVCADFTRPFVLPQPPAGARILVFFPGSTLGNFDPPQAVRLLTQVRRLAGRNGSLLIGFDLVKDAGVLERAYNDAAGVTEAFNLNVLTRLNRELGPAFDEDAFRHRAVWVGEARRIEMRLLSRTRQQILLPGGPIELAAGEALVTEHCHKHTPDSFAALAHAAGWRPVAAWTDGRRSFQVQWLHGYNDS